MSQQEDDAKMIEEMERLEREASAGPWERDDTQARHSINSDMRHIALVSCWKESSREGRENEANASLIPASRNNLPRLLALAKIGVLAVKKPWWERNFESDTGSNFFICKCCRQESDNRNGVGSHEMHDDGCAFQVIEAAIDAYKEKHK